MEQYDCIITGSGPAGLGAAFYLVEKNPGLKILILERGKTSSGGLRNDCKMNFTYPIGFPAENWDSKEAEYYLKMVIEKLKPEILEKKNLETYQRRSARLGVDLINIRQTHLGTDGGLLLIKKLTAELEGLGVEISLGEEMLELDHSRNVVITDKRTLKYRALLIAPGRQGFKFIQNIMDSMGVVYVDHTVDIGIRVETRVEHYPIVKDYYDPKFMFPERVRTFCTNSGNAHVVQERYKTVHDEVYYSVNGHAYSTKRQPNGLANFAMLKTVRFTEPLASGQQFAVNLGLQAMLMGGGRPLMQRVGDFRMGKRSKEKSFNDDLFDFSPSLSSSCPGDISLAMPSKILRYIWKSMKMLDTIVPGVLHPSTIMYYPEIKLYANKPEFLDRHFRVRGSVFFAGDGAGTSRGITAAWASGIRAAEGMLKITSNDKTTSVNTITRS
ncbi:MAG: pyridine nucleotide-disulfide oxidoreductase [Spirochaetes bacterium]|nr:MAG: pyridine nucleotide-disulfide oxidoreductase [Spirochaetota bacterium]